MGPGRWHATVIRLLIGSLLALVSLIGEPTPVGAQAPGGFVDFCCRRAASSRFRCPT